MSAAAAPAVRHRRPGHPAAQARFEHGAGSPLHTDTTQHTAMSSIAHSQRVHIELPITGMTCASCANRIERKL